MPPCPHPPPSWALAAACEPRLSLTCDVHVRGRGLERGLERGRERAPVLVVVLVPAVLVLALALELWDLPPLAPLC
jgi:hypothetical protein